jgi:hypothetical protein
MVRRLRLLVTALIVVLIGGMITVAATLVIRIGEIGEDGPLRPVTAEALTLPRGAQVAALGRAGDEILVLSVDADGVERLRGYSAQDGALVWETAVRRD